MNENQNPMSPATGGSKKLWYIIGGIIILVLLGKMVFWGGAERAAERAFEKATGGKVDAEINADGSATYTTDEGTYSYGSGDLPADWPSDAPVYPGAIIQFSGSSNPETGEAGAALSFQTNDPLTAVMTFYEEELRGNGWAIGARANMGEATTLSAKKGDRNIGIYAVRSGAVTQVTVGISQ